MRNKIELFDDITSFDNLIEAFREISSGHRYIYDFQKIEDQMWEILVELQEELRHGTYKPGKVLRFVDPGPPPRDIVCPTFRDKIVHHAIVRVIIPYLEKYFYSDSYACRKDKGTLKACQRLQEMYRSATGKWGHRCFYVLKGDFKKFFPTLNHDFTLYMYRKLFKDERLIAVMETIIRYYDGAEELFEYGAPIGFLTSQHSGNLVGTALDYFVKCILKAEYYIRVADDFRIFTKTRDEAEDMLEKIEVFVDDKMLQHLSDTKTKIVLAKPYDVFCGYKVFLHHLEPKTATVRRSERRIRKKLRMYENGEITLKQLEDTCDSFKKSYLKHTTVTSNPVLEDAYTFIALKKQELGLVEIEKRKGKEVSVLPVRGAEW